VSRARLRGQHRSLQPRCGVSLHRGCSARGLRRGPLLHSDGRNRRSSLLLRHGKHVLVEKPLWTKSIERSASSRSSPQQGAVAIPPIITVSSHFMRMRELVASGVLGRIYFCRMFLWEWNRRLVRESRWRTTCWRAGGSRLASSRHERFWFGDLEDNSRSMLQIALRIGARINVVIGSERCRCVSSWK